ncbi:hypothetical protein SARC_06026, partial [Sphaeroforma arctica JP610]
ELVDRAQTRLNLIEKQLEPMEKSVMDARASAHRWTDTWLWGGLVVMSTQFGILARMTWWEYSWDVVEPITYFVTFGTVISTYAMYCITRTSTDYSNLSDRKYLQVLHQNQKSGKTILADVGLLAGCYSLPTMGLQYDTPFDKRVRISPHLAKV